MDDGMQPVAAGGEQRHAFADAVAVNDYDRSTWRLVRTSAATGPENMALDQAILEAVSKVSELDLSDVPPTSHPLELVNRFGDDEPHESLTLEQAFANAPARERDLFKVPPTV